MILADVAFGFNVFEVGFLNLLMMFGVFALFGLALTIVTVGIIFRFGTRLAALAWSLPWLFQPLSAAFFPVENLPRGLQDVAYLLPPTYGFEAVRHGLVFHTVDWTLFGIGALSAVVYCVVGIWIFQIFFQQSKKTGQFAKNES